MSHAPSQSTSEASSRQPLRGANPTVPRKRTPFALLEVNGVKVNSNSIPLTPPKRAWVPITPARITLRSPPIAAISSAPPSRIPAPCIPIRQQKGPSQGKENISRYSVSSPWHKPVYESSVEDGEIVADEDKPPTPDGKKAGRAEDLTIFQEEFGIIPTNIDSLAEEMLSSPFKVLLNPGYRSSTIKGYTTTRSQSARKTIDRVPCSEYLRKDHSTPLGATYTLTDKSSLKNPLLAAASPFSQKRRLSRFGESFRVSAKLGEKPPCTGVFSIWEDVSGHDDGEVLSKETDLSLADERSKVLPAEIPFYKLVSPAGVSLPLHSPHSHKRNVVPEGTRVSASLEDSKDIVRFRTTVYETASTPLQEVTTAKKLPQSRIPVPGGQRKIFPLPRLRRNLDAENRESEKGHRYNSIDPTATPVQLQTAKTSWLCPPYSFGSDTQTTFSSPASSLDAASEDLMVGDISRFEWEPNTPRLSGIPLSGTSIPNLEVEDFSTCEPLIEDDDPFLYLFPTPDPFLSNVTRQNSTYNPAKPKTHLPRSCSMPIQASKVSSQAVAEKRARKKKKGRPALLAALQKLFDMEPPPPTPEEDKSLQFYGSKYDRWRGMRV